MKSTFSKKLYRKFFARIFSVTVIAIIIVLLVQSCEKEHATLAAKAVAESNEATATAAITKEQALARLNEYFKNEFSPFTMDQVTGVSKTQFQQWLHNSKMAPAADLYLKPLFRDDSVQYIILKNVILKETGKKASVGLIGTTPKFYSRFTRMVAVINYPNIIVANKHICDWKKCDSYEPCPCILWIDFVVGDCPSDKCSFDTDCRGYSGTDCDGELTGIKTIDVISAF